MAFYGLSKLPFASPQTLQNSPNAPNPPKPAKPSKHRPQTTAGWTLSSSKPSKPLSLNSFPNRHPRARPQQWLSMGFQSCRLPARKGSNPLQNSKPPGPGPQQWDFLWAFKAAVCQPAKAPNFPKQNSKHLPQQAPQGQGHFPNRHPRARAKATSPTGTPGPGHSNGFLWAFKAAVCQPANPPIPPKFQTPRARATAMRLFMGFQSMPTTPTRIAIAAACVRPVGLVLQAKVQ